MHSRIERTGQSPEVRPVLHLMIIFYFSGLIIYLNCERMEESPQLHLIIACFV